MIGPLNRIVEVEWMDANTRGGWSPHEYYKDHAPAAARTVGYLLEKNKLFITVVTTQADDDFNQAI
jgi:hypothetical protein